MLHDALVHPDTVALAVDAIKVPVGKRHGRLSSAQHFINKIAPPMGSQTKFEMPMQNVTISASRDVSFSTVRPKVGVYTVIR